MHIIRSQKHADQLCDDNENVYIKKRTNRCSVVWKCSVSSCGGTAKTALDYAGNDNGFLLTTAHSDHPILGEKTKKKILMQKMKDQMLISDKSPRNVFYSVIRGEGEEIIRAMGHPELCYRILRYYRKTKINPAPYLYEDIKISSFLSVTYTMETFYQYGPGNYGRFTVDDNILLFFSTNAVSRLNENRIWACDGTFSIVPDPYSQLYTISYIKENHVFPSIFAILKNKTQSTYTSLFKLLKDIIPSLDPEAIKTDFETAAISGLRTTFSSARISGCMFHLGQAVDRKIKEQGLMNTYKTDATFKRYTKALVALTYVKQEDISSVFTELRNSNDFPPAINAIYDYFFRTYIHQNAKFPIELWHSLGNDSSLPRTNNAIEGWHNIFRNTFGTSRYSFDLLLKKLKDEEDVIRIRSIQQDILGMQFERKKQYVVMETNLTLFLNENAGYETGLTYLFELINKLFYVWLCFFVSILCFYHTNAVKISDFKRGFESQ